MESHCLKRPSHGDTTQNGLWGGLKFWLLNRGIDNMKRDWRWVLSAGPSYTMGDDIDIVEEQADVGDWVFTRSGGP